MSDYKNNVCPVCGKAFGENDDIVVCPDCGTPHHRACYKKNGHCANAEKHGSFEWASEKKNASDPMKNAELSVFCINCGERNSASSRFCSNCGAQLPGKEEPEVSPEERFSQERSRIYFENIDNADFNGATARETAQVVHSNVEYFLPRFFAFSKGRKFDTNFCAFLFSYLYLFYRKMYGIGFAVMAATFILQIPALLLDLQTMQEAYVQAGLLTQAVWEVPHRESLVIYAGIAGILIWAIKLLLFLFANRLYYAHATGIAKGIRDGLTEEGSYDEFLFAGIARKKGGATIVPVVLIFAVLVLVGFSLAYMLVSSPYFVLPALPV